MAGDGSVVQKISGIMITAEISFNPDTPSSE